MTKISKIIFASMLFSILSALLGCQKETDFKTASNVRVHEIVTISVNIPSTTPDTNYWYVFFKNGKFVYTKSLVPMSDFSSTFFLSSKKIPKEIEFAEEFIKAAFEDTTSDEWGVSIKENDSADFAKVIDTALVKISNDSDAIPIAPSDSLADSISTPIDYTIPVVPPLVH